MNKSIILPHIHKVHNNFLGTSETFLNKVFFILSLDWFQTLDIKRVAYFHIHLPLLVLNSVSLTQISRMASAKTHPPATLGVRKEIRKTYFLFPKLKDPISCNRY